MKCVSRQFLIPAGAVLGLVTLTAVWVMLPPDRPRPETVATGAEPPRASVVTGNPVIRRPVVRTVPEFRLRSQARQRAWPEARAGESESGGESSRQLIQGRPLIDVLEALDDANSLDENLDGGERGSLLWALDLCAQVDSPPPAGIEAGRVLQSSPLCHRLDGEDIDRWRRKLAVPPERIWTDLGLEDILELRKQGFGADSGELRELALEHLRQAGDFYSFVELLGLIGAPFLESLWQQLPDHDLVLEYHLAMQAAWLKMLCREAGGCGPDGLVTLELCMSLITRCRPGDGFADVVLNNLGPETQAVFWDWVDLAEDHRRGGSRLVRHLDEGR